LLDEPHPAAVSTAAERATASGAAKRSPAIRSRIQVIVRTRQRARAGRKPPGPRYDMRLLGLSSGTQPIA
jgi:hypothetical protein